jgi:hypothetical protein
VKVTAINGREKVIMADEEELVDNIVFSLQSTTDEIVS